MPIQKSLKIEPKISSTSTLPTIIPSCLVASLRSSAALSKSPISFLFSKFSKCSTHFIKCCLCLSLVIIVSSVERNLFFNLSLILEIKLSLDRAEKADLKLVVVDAKSIDFSGFLNDLLKDNAILVINKSDLINGELDPEVNKLDHVLISLKENKNLDKLISKIKNKLKKKFIINDDILITRERHRQHLVHCSENLKNFLEKNDKKDFDKAAEDLRLATRHLGMIVGKVDVEEILGSIFNDFCIGK